MDPSSTFVIVGASLAGASAAATLRDEGFDGRVVYRVLSVLLEQRIGRPVSRFTLNGWVDELGG